MQTGLLGGKLLAQGTDGCVFIPKLKCKGNSTDFFRTSSKMVDKLSGRKEAEHEFQIAEKIVEIPMANNYFIFPKKICEPLPLEKQINENLKKCELDLTHNKFKILRMPYGGVSLPYYSFNIKNFSFLLFVKHLLESGTLLALNGVVHNDIHMGNILIDENQVPRIIDFSRSLFVYENIKEKDLLVETAGKSAHLCPDFSLINDRISGYNLDYFLYSYVKNQENIIRYMNVLLHYPENTIIHDLEEFTLLSTSYQKLDILGWFSHHWRTIDSWALGIAILTMITSFIYFPEFDAVWKEEGFFLIPVLKRLLEINPFRRIDCVQALDMLANSIGENNIIIDKYAKSWLDKIGRVTVTSL